MKKMNELLNKSMADILKEKYVIPLYQRNFAWREEEISQFLQDIYEAFRNDKEKNYYIGSLVVIRRQDGSYEVIDGQQRLTVISLIAKILNKELLKPNIFYDSRPEVENFFYNYYITCDVSTLPTDNKLFHLINAVGYIKNTILNPYESIKNQITILDTDEDFKIYFFHKVVIVKVEMPPDTDVAAYFEIMNNRGEQLNKHEIVKARLISKIQSSEEQQLFSEIWDACSQMDAHIQKLFIKEKRTQYFGENYDDFIFGTEVNQPQIIKTDNVIQALTIDDILEMNNPLDQPKEETIEDVDDTDDDKSIIDFPNFLMHVFRLLYNDCYKGKSKWQDIPLNEKYLIEIYNQIEQCIEAPIKFIKKMLFYRVVFDRFVVKATRDEDAEGDFKWSLLKPYKYYYEKRKIVTLKYKNTFKVEVEQEYIIKALSLLQVTFRQKIYKNWLQEILSWFNNESDLDIEAEDYLQKLNNYILNYYKQLNLNIQKESCYSEGTRTPHFLLNFIDYLYWIKYRDKFHFDFKYRNSIEHHLPQSFENDENSREIIDCLGNLFLVNKSSNSRMNNEAPEGKASKNGKYYRSNLPPKQKIMYDITNERGQWGKEEIIQHYNDVVELLNQAESILKYNE